MNSVDNNIKISFGCSFKSKTKIRNFVRSIDEGIIPVDFLYSHWDEHYVRFVIYISNNMSLKLAEILKIKFENMKLNIEYTYKIINIDNVYSVSILILDTNC